MGFGMFDMLMTIWGLYDLGSDWGWTVEEAFGKYLAQNPDLKSAKEVCGFSLFFNILNSIPLLRPAPRRMASARRA